MVLRLEDKKAIIEDVANIAGRSIAAGVANYRGLTVSEMTELRTRARKEGIYLRVVRNTLARRAIADTVFSCMQETLTGPVFVAFSEEDPGAVARLLKNAVRDYKKLIVCALVLQGKLLPAKDLDAVASLPTRDQALASLLVVMKAPITKLARTMAEPYAMLVRTTAAVRDKKINNF